MTYSKIGFHTAVGGNKDGLGAWERQLNAADIPVFIKSADEYGILAEALALGAQYGVDNWLIYRVVLEKPHDVPNYYIDPRIAADEYWRRIIGIDRFPPEFDKSRVWLDVLNEPRAQEDVDSPNWNGMHPVAWLGAFSVRIGEIALRDGYKVCLPSFNSGEPNEDDYEHPEWLAFLQMCGDFPDRIALSVHEYSWDLWKTDPHPDNWYPYLWGRLENFIAACDMNGLNRDITIFVTEFGWGHDGHTIPPVAQGMEFLRWYDEWAAKWPQVKGVALWNLQSDWAGIANAVQPYIAPLTAYQLANSFDEGEQPAMTYLGTLPGDIVEPPIEPPTTAPKIVIVKKPQKAAMTQAENQRVTAWAWENYGRTTTHSTDDMLTMLRGGNSASYAVVWWEERQQETITALEQAGFAYITMPKTAVFSFTHWPTPYRVVNQVFGNNPDYYAQFNLPGHEGTDIRAYHGDPIYAVADGIISQVHGTAEGSNYGIYLRVNHGDGWETTYAHLDRLASRMHVNEVVSGGQVIGYADNTGNSSGSHLHLTLKRIGHVYTDESGNVWPYNIHNSDSFLRPFANVTWPSAPTPPPPPSGQTVAIAPYFEPQGGDIGVHVVFHFDNGSTQPQQMIRQANGRVVMFKGEGQWIDGQLMQDYEEWLVDSTGVRKYVDTSDAGNSGRDAYNLHGEVWLPAIVQVGAVYVSKPVVSRFDRVGCAVHSNERTTDYLYVREIITNWVSPKNAAISFADVLVVEWRKTPDINTPAAEVYKFAADVGYVAWGGEGRSGAAVGELPQGRQPLGGALTTCT